MAIVPPFLGDVIMLGISLGFSFTWLHVVVNELVIVTPVNFDVVSLVVVHLDLSLP